MAYGHDYRTENRQGGCDLIPSAPPPVLLNDGEEYVDTTKDKGHPPASPAPVATPEGDAAGKSLFPLIGWIICLAVTMWLFAASSPFLANALTQSGWRFWTSIALGSLPLVFVSCLAVYVWIRFRRMPRVEQIDASSCGKGEQQRLLTTVYFSKFPAPEQYAAENGFADGEGTDREVAACLTRLRGGRLDCARWSLEFERFQKLQDGRARGIVWNAAKLVGVKTAISPWKIVDMAAVVYNSTVMITRLAKLYNRRASGRAAFRLACRWIVNIYIAGELGDMAQDASEWTADLVSGTLKPLAGVLGKAAEGGANGLLVRRLGLRAIAEFRPLINETK